MRIEDIETPAVLIDLDLVEANIARAQTIFDQLGKGFRPHIKTHKIPSLARLQMKAGAIGIACQKISEAEVFAADGFDDILEPILQPVATSSVERSTRPTEELPVDRIQKLVEHEEKQQQIRTSRNAKIEDEVSTYPEPEDALSDIPARHIKEKRPLRGSLIPQFIFRLPPMARPLVVGSMTAVLTIALIGLFSIAPKKLLTGAASTSSVSEEGTSQSASDDSHDTGFPHIEGGTYAGSVTGILPGITSPLALISRPEHNELTVVVGIDGWTPVSVSILQEEGTEPSSTIVARSNGVLLNMTGETSSDTIIGTFTNAITGETGTWSVKKVS